MTILETNSDFPCQHMFHVDDETNATHLMFERPLNADERQFVRASIPNSTNSHWADEQTLCVIA